MDIIVIGNGFDLANGLPTSYQSYFKYRHSKLNELYALDRKLDNIIKEYWEDEDIYQFDDGNFEKFRDEIVEIIEKMKNDKMLNFWDLHFYKLDLDNPDWNNVEDEIAKFVIDFPKLLTGVKLASATGTAIEPSRAETELVSPLQINEKNKAKKNEAMKNEAKKKTINSILQIFIDENIEKYSNDLDRFFISELNKFEKDFSEYMGLICQTVCKNKLYTNTYSSNIKKILANRINESSNCCVLNFNYSVINETFQVDKFSFDEINVHGKYSEKIIFGIDSKVKQSKTEQSKTEKSEINYYDAYYRYTKTYRKIEANYMPQKLPDKNDLTQIIFYGHSLSDADYSYFQSLFDLYDIYNQTTLIFLYSIFKGKTRKEIETDLHKNIVKLISTYGETMDNKNHGKNLLHKLLLEGRLQLREIKLKDMEFSFEN